MSGRQPEGQSRREDFGQTARGKIDHAMPRDDIIFRELMFKELKDALPADLLRAVGRLRHVREPGRGRLTLKEAREAAARQAEAYARAFREGRPVRRVEVWVEGGRVMSVAPGDAARLKDFNFDVASAADAVLQVCKAEEGEERVVLLTVPLRGVAAGGRAYAAELPNGQKYTLEIKPEPGGRFAVRLAFDTHALAPEPTRPEDGPENRPVPGLVGRAVATMAALLNSWPALVPRYLMAFLIPLAVLFALPNPPPFDLYRRAFPEEVRPAGRTNGARAEIVEPRTGSSRRALSRGGRTRA